MRLVFVLAFFLMHCGENSSVLEESSRGFEDSDKIVNSGSQKREISADNNRKKLNNNSNLPGEISLSGPNAPFFAESLGNLEVIREHGFNFENPTIINDLINRGIIQKQASRRLGISWQGKKDFEIVLFNQRGKILGVYKPIITWGEGSNFNGYIDAPISFYGLKLKTKLSDLDFISFHFLKEIPKVKKGAVQSGSYPLMGSSSLIKSRNSWGAKTTRCTTRHKPTKATIHHSVTPNNDSLSFQARLRQIQNFHQSVRGWCDIGYHYLISKDGSVWQGRNADLQGAHVGGNNHGNLGISFLGTFSNVKPSGAQLNSAAKLLRNIKSAYAIKINSSTIKGHRDYGGTACPGSSLYGKIAALIYSANQNSSVNSPSPNNPQIKVSVNLLSPSNNASVDNPVTFKFKFKNVDQLYVKANGWNFHSKKNPGENYSFTYKFHSTGLRDLVIEASNSKTGKVEKISRKINVRSSQNFINPSLKLLSPSDGVSLKNPVTFKFETKDIDNLTLKADGYLFHSKAKPGKNHSFTYNFYTLGWRNLTLEGKNNKTGKVFKIQRRIHVLKNSPNPTFQPKIELLSPGNSAQVDNLVTFKFLIKDIDSLTVKADKWTFHNKDNPSSNYKFTYKFFTTGKRNIIIEARNKSTGKLLKINRTINVRNPSNTSSNNSNSNGSGLSTANNSNVPYFYQASNKNNPYSSCGATSTAMLINFRFGSKTNPDKLQVSYGKSAMQSPEGIAKTMGRFGLKTKWTRTGTRSQIKSHLKAGRPVIVHGFWTNSGHIVVITGFNSSAWILHDPAGDWNRGYFRSSSAGRSIKHSFGGSFDKKMSSDGDIWFSTASKSSF